MYKTVRVNHDLLHLQNVLFDLDNYSFDKDVISLLNKLKTLVDQKMYKGYSFVNYNVRDKDVILLYEYENEIYKKNSKKY